MRLTIERIRTLVLAAGVVLVAALVAFLVIGHWKSHFNLREIPKRLGVDIQQEANGVTYTQSHGGHTLFKIHASKVVQLKQGGRALLHDVQIELYGEDGNRVDRIVGDEFEYDQKDGKAIAAGPVEITLMRPGVPPAVAPRAAAGTAPKATALANAEQRASQGEIHVKTSGLTFDQKSGVATTAERVEFAITQGSGSSIGATFDSEKGQLVLDRSVVLDVRRGSEQVRLHAQHAEFNRDNLECRMHGAQGSFSGGEASAGDATFLFRPDGSAVRLDAVNGFSMTTNASAHLEAPQGWLEFDEHNQPRHGRLEGGASMDSAGNGRQIHGTSPSADLEFTADGLLHQAHLQRGVTIHSEESSARPQGGGESLKTSRDWKSPVADLNFREAGKGKVELASVTGTDGVVITGQTEHGNGPTLPLRMAADQVNAVFGEGQILSTAVGTGHAVLEQTTGSGVKQTTAGDRIEAAFAPPSERVIHGPEAHTGSVKGSSLATPGGAMVQIQSARVDGNVVLVQLPTAKPGGPAVTPMRATAGHALYEGAGEWLHLTMHPRVENGDFQLTADRVDVSQASGDALAHGNVKASVLGSAPGKPGNQAKRSLEGGTFGGEGPTHVVADEAQMREATGEATFQGRARLWQEANSISAPVIVLDRNRRTLVARSTGAAEPVRIVLLSAGSAEARKGQAQSSPKLSANSTERSGHGEGSAEAELPGMGHGNSPAVVRVRGGDLKYSEAERKAIIHAGAGVPVVAETEDATSISNELELRLLPPGNHAGKDGNSAQVDRITASGNVRVSSQGRRGTGERLVYSSETDDFVLTGTVSAPPQLMDMARGTVSGDSLIFNRRDDSVSVEGGGRKTSTRAVAPK